jgi:hypothetical protein
MLARQRTRRHGWAERSNPSLTDQLQVLGHVTTVAVVDSDRPLDEATLSVFIEELNTRQVDDPGLCVLDAVHELLGLLGHRKQEDKTSKNSSSDKAFLNPGIHLDDS